MSNGKTLLTLGDDRERLSGYAQIRVFEGDCDRAQAQIRTAASTWILAGLGGLFVAYSEHRPGQLSSELLSAVVCLLAVSGIAILWTVDQRVYQKLLHAAFVYGLAVEAQNPDLPQIRTMMNLTSGKIGPFISFYYLGPIIVFTSLCLVFASMDNSWIAYLATVTSFIILGVCFSVSRAWKPLEELLSSFNDRVQSETRRARMIERMRESEPLRKGDPE